MRKWWLLGLVLLGGCVGLPPVAMDPNDGYLHLPFPGTFECEGRPTAITSNGRKVTIRGGCRQVAIVGSHEDVVAYVEPGATIEVVGSYNRIVYRLVRRGPAPRWVDRGLGNELIRNSFATWERDHDWYQEQH